MKTIKTYLSPANKANNYPYYLFFMFILLFLSACGRNVPELTPLAEDAVILAFGDSLTYGTGAGAETNYPAVLAKLSGRQVINAGKPGELSKEGVKRLPDLLDKHQPALLILCHGGNDFIKKESESALIDNLRTMIQAASNRDIQVVLLGVPQPAPIMLSGAKLYNTVAKVYEIPYEGLVLAKVLSQPELKSDPIHPNAAGYQQIAEALLRLLQDAGALPTETS